MASCHKCQKHLLTPHGAWCHIHFTGMALAPVRKKDSTPFAPTAATRSPQVERSHRAVPGGVRLAGEGLGRCLRDGGFTVPSSETRWRWALHVGPGRVSRHRR